MTQQEMFGGARWIGVDEGVKAPYIRSDFDVEKCAKAEITICGLGFFELFINGERVSEDWFVPVTSDYVKRDMPYQGKPFDEEMGHRVYCVKYDLSSYVKEGKNNLGVALGAGWYDVMIYSHGGESRYGDVRLCYRLSWTDTEGNVHEELSGTDARWLQSPITRTDLFMGENHDYRLEPTENWKTSDYTDWKPVRLMPEIETEYCIQDCPGDKIIRYLEPSLVADFAGKKVYDAGENISGWVIVETEGAEGEKILIRFSEELNKTKALDRYYVFGQEWNIICDGKKRELHPHFTWYGFRYFSVEGPAKVKTVAVLHCDVPVTSSFHTNSETLNWLYKTYVHTQLMNMHAGIPSDCPHIERRGYTGDGQLTCEAVMLMIGSQEFYRKWMRDISDCQDRISGHVQYTAPYQRCGGGPGGWGIAIITVPYQYYRAYGDSQPLKDMYAGMLEYLRYLEDHSENHLVVSDKPGEWCLGDWCTPEPITISAPYVNTYFHIKARMLMKEIEEILGLPYSDPDGAKEKVLRQALTDHFFDPETGDFERNIQGANAFAMDIGMGDERTLQHIVEQYQKRGCYDTGIFGTEIVTRLLFEKGYGDLAYELLTTDKEISFEGWRRGGATTFWEYFPGEYGRSHSHPMFGAVTTTLFHYILGVHQVKGSYGWKEIEIAPLVTEQLPEAKGSFVIPQGEIKAEYIRGLGKVHFRFEIPAGVKASFIWKGEKQELGEGIHEFSKVR